MRQVQVGSEEQGKVKKTGFEIICVPPTTLEVKGQMTDGMYVVVIVDVVH